MKIKTKNRVKNKRNGLNMVVKISGKKNQAKKFGIALIFLIVLQLSLLLMNTNTSLSTKMNESPNYINNLSPVIADVSGNELYAEQIHPTIYGGNGIITQSFISNDTNIFSGIDFLDPAFEHCSLFISLSNGVSMDIEKDPITSSIINPMTASFDYPHGFLYYNYTIEQEKIDVLQPRAFSILSDLFNLDLIITDVIEDHNGFGYLYEFIGHYPSVESWENTLYKITSNLPDDGYWSAFDRDRLSSEEYLENHHLSSNIVYSNRLSEFFSIIPNITTAQGYISGFDLTTQDLIGELLETVEPILASAGGETEGMDIDEIFGMLGDLSFDLTNAVLCSMVYEMPENAIEEIGITDQYSFDLFKALNYNGDDLRVSSKSFNSLVGTILSGLSVNLYSAEVMETNPSDIYLDESNLNRIEELLFLTGLGGDFEISALKDYSFTINWEFQDGVSHLMSMIQNIDDEADPINTLGLLFSGFPILLTSILNPIEEFEIIYELISNEPSVKITKTVSDCSNIVNGVPDMEITVENVGDDLIWGQAINPNEIISILYLLSEQFGFDLSLFLPSGFEDLDLSNDPYESTLLRILTPTITDDTMDDVFAQIEHQGYDIKQYFSNEDPRLFMVDSYGLGIPDYIYPDVLSNPTNFLPYSTSFTDLYDNNQIDVSLFTFEMELALFQLMEIFRDPISIYNPENWILDHGEGFSYTVPAYNQFAVVDTYQNITNGQFDASNIVDTTPNLIYGEEIVGTTIDDTYEFDNSTWNLESELVNENNLIKFEMVFENVSTIDFDMFELNAINFDFINRNQDINITELDSIVFEVFNYSAGAYGEFTELANIVVDYSIVNMSDTDYAEIISFNILDNQYNLSDFYKLDANFNILTRFTFEHSESFSIEWDEIQVNLWDRVNNIHPLVGAQMTCQSENGNLLFRTTSNTISLGTDHTSSVYGLTELDTYTCETGNSVLYNLTVFNNGNKNAYNVSIVLEQPGILENLQDIESNEVLGTANATAGSFKLVNGMLIYFIPVMAPYSSEENITYQFKSPNSRSIPIAIIQWDDYNLIDDNYTSSTTLVNSLYLSSPIDYTTVEKTPYYHSLDIDFITDYIGVGTSDIPPKINETFSISLQIKNTGENTIYGILFDVNSNYEGLRYLNSSDTIWIDELLADEIKYVTLEFTKTGARGYTISIPTYINSLENGLILINNDSPLLLGVYGVEITKRFDKLSGEIGEEFNITVFVKNTGTIELGNFTINDINSISEGLSLAEGITVNKIGYLDLDDTYNFTYKVIIMYKGQFELRAAELTYCYKEPVVSSSNSNWFMAREKPYILRGRIFFPILIGIALISYYYFNLTKYNQSELNLNREERAMFGSDMMEDQWHDITLEEHLTREEKKKQYSS